ncbi:uncharacterized protein ACIQIH_003124 isoform 3-T4 [Cyanocitta cristata]
MPHATLSSTGKGEWLLGIRCTAAIPSHSRTVLAAPQTAGFFHNSAQASEFCLTDQLNGFPKSTEFSMPDSAPVARTFMAAVSFALGSDGGKKKKATMDPVPKVEIFFFILQTRLKIGGE